MFDSNPLSFGNITAKHSANLARKCGFLMRFAFLW